MFTTTCADCGAPLRRDWTADGLDLTEWHSPGEPRPRTPGEALDGIRALLAERPALRGSDVVMQAYTTLLIADGQHRPIPGTHRHQPAPAAPYAGVVPECCGWPARLVRDGWLCRVDGAPVVEERAA